MSRRLKSDDLRATCDPATLPFRSTAELTPLDGSIIKVKERLKAIRGAIGPVSNAAGLARKGEDR